MLATFFRTVKKKRNGQMLCSFCHKWSDVVFPQFFRPDVVFPSIFRSDVAFLIFIGSDVVLLNILRSEDVFQV